MKKIPLSLPIAMGMVVYKNRAEKRPVIETTRDFQRHGMHESTLHLPLHTGTHVDYPLHAIDGGKTSSDYQVFPIRFKAAVLDLTTEHWEKIGLAQLEGIDFKGIDAIFFKTLKSPLKTFDFEFPWLDSEAASMLSQLPLKFVGTDQPGIERNQPGHETHIQLLAKDILIFEGLDLSNMMAGVYTVEAYTLQIENVEAEPVAVYALDEDEPEKRKAL